MPKTLLLADDSVTIQKVVGISFANEDIKLVTVDNGTDAIARAREMRPDIVLADVVMPGKNGYEVCEAIKSDPSLASVPVLLLTGTFETFDEERAAQVGADGHITKPFEAQALVDQVNSRLAEAAANAPLSQEPEGLGLTGMVSPGEASSEAYDLFEDEVTAPSGVAPTETPPTTVLIGGEPMEDDHAQTWAEDFGPPSGKASTPPETSATDRAAFASGAPDAAADDLFDDSARDRTQAFLLDDEFPSERPGYAHTEPAPPAAGDDLFDERAASASDDLFDDPADSATRIVDDASALGGSRGDAASASDFDRRAEATVFDAPPSSLLEESDGATTTLLDEPSAARTTVLDEPAARTTVLEDPAARTTVLEAPEGFAFGDADEDSIPGADLMDDGPDLLGSARADASDLLASATADVPDLLADSDDPLLGASGTATPAFDADAVRGYDVSSSDLSEAARQAPSAELPGAANWPAEPDEEPLLLDEPAPFETAEIFPDTEPVAHPASASEPVTRGAPAALSPMLEKQLHDGLEKLAWDAFGGVAEEIVKEAVARIEKVAWEVIPKLAETLVREEIRKLKGE